MKKKITFTASYIFEVDDEDLLDDQEYNTFDDVENSDYDNVGRPIERLRDLGWNIYDKEIEEA